MFGFVAKETADRQNKPKDYSSDKYDIKKASDEASKIKIEISQNK